ncbi:17.3 kDa class I heat shock protein [Helianthus annuus]|nr:17.3 kDa class I heat shock protein [Helianthus annuus]
MEFMKVQSSRTSFGNIYKWLLLPIFHTKIIKNSIESVRYLHNPVIKFFTLSTVSVKHLKMSIVPSLFGGRRSSAFDPFSLDLWDPFRDFPISSSSDVSRETSGLVNALVDWKETPEAHVFKADLPGIKKEEVKVEVEDGNILQITGEKNVEKEDKNDKWHRVERSSGKFTRRFRLPENAKMDQVKAAMENGVLTITVPKEEAKKPDVKSIEISG